MQKLKTKFKNLSRPNFKIKEENPCHECLDRHNELIKGREFTFDDLRCSCHNYMFYEFDMFPYLLPILLRSFINNPKEWYTNSYLIDSFFNKMRRKELITHAFYSKEQKDIIINTLEHIKATYYMEDFEVWDYEKEKIVHYFEEESLYNEIKETLIFWEEHLQVKYDQ